MRSLYYTIFITLLALVPTSAVLGQASSTSFRLYGDAIVGEGGRSTSASYLMEGTSGEAGSGPISSVNYNLLSGFQELSEHPTFTFAFNRSSIDLGDISTSSVSTEVIRLTTATNADFGYITSVSEDTDFIDGAETIDDVADGTVTAGDEEYGIGVTGTDAAFGTHEPLTEAALVIATRNTWTAGTHTYVTHYAAVSPTTVNGSYSHTVSYVSVGTF